MNNPEIAALHPVSLFKHFDALTGVPRPSKKEAKAVAWLTETIRNMGYEPIVDEVGNVVVRKPGSKGHENAPMLLLQGHLDMVCEKNRDTVHDFDNDPIPTVLDGDWIKTKGTTLGADNGVGVALGLALLESTDVVHPPLEMLFTIDEETGMTGASALKKGQVQSHRMINLDSEEEGIVYVGCAGGGDTVGRLALNYEAAPSGLAAMSLSVGGLRGGHSGTDIQKGRGNAIQIMGQALRMIVQGVEGTRIVTLQGGSKRNAIAREAEAIVLVPADKVQEAKAIAAAVGAEVLHALAPVEPDLKVEFSASDAPCDRALEKGQADRILDTILALPHGVLRMSSDIEGLVETSTNLATVTMEGDTLVIGTSQRSLIDSVKAEAVRKVQAALRLGGFSVKSGAGYPGWKPDMNSKLLATFCESYEELFHKKPLVLAIHAGLECGLIGEVFPGMDMISVGPTILDPHSPAERLSVPDVRKFWDTLILLLKKLA